MYNIFNKHKVMFSIKKRTLLNFIEANKHLPQQGSTEWLQSRSETIGGSEISTILNINKYQSIKQLIMQKSGVSIFKKAPPLWFGNIFEYILQQYVEELFDTKIFETGSIPYKKSNLIKYSPDGLAVIKLNKLNQIFSDSDLNSKIYNKSIFNNNNNQELLILFEFKNPYMRVIKKNEIPIYYINQPKLGMEVIDICEASIFIESIFRFCSYNDIININNKYNIYYHYDRIRYTQKPLAYGAYTLYYDKNNISNNLSILLNDIVDYLNYNNIHQYDLSAITNKTIINRLMEHIIDYKDIKIFYHDLCINSNIYSNTDKFKFIKYNNKSKFINNILIQKNNILLNPHFDYLGIMSFKMFDININPIFKSNPINKDVLIKINNVINLIKECNKLDSIDQKKIYINSNIKNI